MSGQEGKPETPEFTEAEIAAQGGEELPAREVMSVISSNPEVALLPGEHLDVDYGPPPPATE